VVPAILTLTDLLRGDITDPERCTKARGPVVGTRMNIP